MVGLCKTLNQVFLPSRPSQIVQPWHMHIHGSNKEENLDKTHPSGVI